MNLQFDNYQQAIDWMMLQLPMFSRVGQSAYNPSLDKITALCNRLRNPQNTFKTIHVAGTNGKGSTSHILAATLQQGGYKVGLYTSPHLIDLRERMRINGALISEQFVVDFLNQNAAYILEIQPSYFEINVAMAFKAFADAKVDVAVIEVGLGGRLDSTNIIIPEISVITNISLDHTHILGDTLPKIAGEKAGIIKDKIPVIIGESNDETAPVFVQKAATHLAPIRFADNLYSIVKVQQDVRHQTYKLVDNSNQTIITLTTDLLGNFQSHNIITSYAAVKLLESLGWNVSTEVFQAAIQQVKSLTGLRGRWDWIQTNPNVILDVGHNEGGILTVVDQLQHPTFQKGNIYFVIGFVADKDVDKVLGLMPKNAHYVVTQANIPRALAKEALLEKVTAHGLQATLSNSPSQAVADLLNTVNPEDHIIISGSFFIVADAMIYLKSIGKLN